MRLLAPLGSVLLALLALAACSPSSDPEVGSQTNWLRACDQSADCGELECVCGACSLPCESTAACEELPAATCAAEDDDGAIALCAGRKPPSGVCLPRCEPSCDRGASCVAGACVPNGEPSVELTIDLEEQGQTLVGFGASLAYAETPIVMHAQKDSLYDLLFADSGLDVLRMRNRHANGSADELSSQQEIIEAATERMGARPLLLMTSGTPPAALKANGSLTCAGDPDTCTLITLAGGGFDYEGFARHWRAALEAYASAGIAPDYVSIQNNPNWVPPASAPNDACRFLPEEGTTTVRVNGTDQPVRYPGYREALEAVRSELSSMPAAPRILAPEASSLAAIDEYVASLDATAFDALALHLYYQDAGQTSAVDGVALASIRDLAGQLERPVFQTEMQATGLDTAFLIHHAITAGGASAYLQNDLVSWMPETADVSLVRLSGGSFNAQDPYFALAHYAKHTDPGWVRVEATSDSSELLGSAWLAPDERALTVVLLNPSEDELSAQLVLMNGLRERLPHTQVTRTVFEGLERFASLGALPETNVVRVPAESIVTVSLTAE